MSDSNPFILPGSQQNGPWCTPVRSPGNLGVQDAADPSGPAFGRGDTPGVLGVGDGTWLQALGVSRPARRANMCWAGIALPRGWALDLDTFCDQYEQVKEPPFGRLKAEVRANLRRFLTRLAADARIVSVHHAAYLLATTLHEGRSAATKWAMTWDPVSETKPKSGGGAYFNAVVVRDWDGTPIAADGTRIAPLAGADGKPKLGKKHPSAVDEASLGSYYDAKQFVRREYYGRGYVQITHLDNYRSMDEALGLGRSLMLNPERALEHEVAFNIAVYGMVNGSFRGKRTHEAGRGMVGGHKLSDYEADYTRARAIINGGGDKATEIAAHAVHFQQLIQCSRVA